MWGQVAQFLPQRKERQGRSGLAELEESLAVTNKSRRLGERRKATSAKKLINVCYLLSCYFIIFSPYSYL